MAVAKAEGNVDLFEWELEQVSYGFTQRIPSPSFLTLPTALNVETTASRWLPARGAFSCFVPVSRLVK